MLEKLGALTNGLDTIAEPIGIVAKLNDDEFKSIYVNPDSEFLNCKELSLCSCTAVGNVSVDIAFGDKYHVRYSDDLEETWSDWITLS